MSKNKTKTISVSTLAKRYYEYKISCYLITYPRVFQICKLHYCAFLKLFQYTNNILTSLLVKIKVQSSKYFDILNGFVCVSLPRSSSKDHQHKDTLHNEASHSHVRL